MKLDRLVTGRQSLWPYLLVLAACNHRGEAVQPAPVVAPVASSTALVPPAERFEVARVVDGDTLHVLRGGRIDKLRLLSVDTEEKTTPGFQNDKPATAFGDECARWAV
jgi:endonuclease YncB( thermonuclease family)